jgi:hypothetical protein
MQTVAKVNLQSVQILLKIYIIPLVVSNYELQEKT